jgi:hypothetical protein
VPQLKMSKNNEQDSTPYVPKTDEKRNEAFGLLDELLKELGREEALRRKLARSLLKVPLEELEPKELRKELPPSSPPRAARSSPAGRPVFGPNIAPPSRDLERLHNGKLEALKEAAVSRLEQAIENIKANSLNKAKEQELPPLVLALLPSHRLLVRRREIGKE